MSAEEKNPEGRPLKFKKPEELTAKVDEYFEYIKGQTEEVQVEIKKSRPVLLGSESERASTTRQPEYETHLKVIRDPEPPTITGLCLFLGFESRQSFYAYEQRAEFCYTIKRARMRIESEYEKCLFRQSPTGAIFALKNMGWSDKTEVEQHTTLRDESYDYSKLTDEQRNLLADIQFQLRSKGSGQ